MLVLGCYSRRLQGMSESHPTLHPLITVLLFKLVEVAEKLSARYKFVIRTGINMSISEERNDTSDKKCQPRYGPIRLRKFLTGGVIELRVEAVW